MDPTPQFLAARHFATLHKAGCFVIPNPWDIGTARYLHHLGFEALATTSAGFAFTRGRPDNVSRDEMLAHVAEIVRATPLPVSADFQNGYASAPEDVATNVALCVATGVAGLSIEDATGDKQVPLYDFDLAVKRIRAARASIDASGMPIVLTARCEAWLVGLTDASRVARERLVAYADAGADCLYAPRVQDPEEIRAIVKDVSPRPVNALALTPTLSVARLADLGVRRISVGATLSRVAWGAFMDAAAEIRTSGTFEAFSRAASFDKITRGFGDREE
jgi:2-methylisocitrate lyase-like PEP mutase family enzyme